MPRTNGPVVASKSEETSFFSCVRIARGSCSSDMSLCRMSPILLLRVLMLLLCDDGITPRSQSCRGNPPVLVTRIMFTNRMLVPEYQIQRRQL